MERATSGDQAGLIVQQVWGSAYQLEEYKRMMSAFFPGVLQQGGRIETNGRSVLELGRYDDRSGKRIRLAEIGADWDEPDGWHWAAEWLQSSGGDAAVVAWVKPGGKRSWLWSLLTLASDAPRITRFAYVFGTESAHGTKPPWLHEPQRGSDLPTLDELLRWFDPERPRRELLGPLRQEWERLSVQLMGSHSQHHSYTAERAGQAVKQWMLRLVEPLFTGRSCTESRPEGLEQRDTLAVRSLLADFPFHPKEDTPFDRRVAIDPEELGYMFEHLRFAGERKSRGVFYTPRQIVDEMCRQCLATYVARTTGRSQGEMLRWLSGDEEISCELASSVEGALRRVTVADPSVGSGAFAVHMAKLIWEARQRLASANGPSPGSILREILAHSMYAVDMDAAAIQLVELRLRLLLQEAERVQGRATSVPTNFRLRVGNGLSELWSEEFPEVCDPPDGCTERGFDIVIGNPPYVDSEAMARGWPELRAYGQSHFVSAKGNWDLYVLFIEQGLRLLKRGGVLSYIVPNKLLSSPYAETIRREMARERVVELRDYSRVEVFTQAEVYPIVFRLERCDELLPVRVIRMRSVVEAEWEDAVDGERFDRDVDWDRYVAGSPDGLRIIEKLRLIDCRLGDRFKIKGASTVAEAYQLQALIRELPTESHEAAVTKGHRLINTGLIDPYVSLWGDKELRYIKQRYRRPFIRTTELAALSSTRAAEAAAPKLIVAGMGLRLEACLDLAGAYVAGKSTSILLGSPEELKLTGALLNSELMSYYYRRSYSTLAMSGGYLRVGPPQLRELPWVEAEAETKRELIRLVDLLLVTTELRHRERYIREIDQMIYRLYQVTADEVALIEGEQR